MSRHMQLRTTVRLEETLLEQAKSKAAREKRTLTSLIEEGLRLVISKSVPPAKRKRITLPVSRRGGGLMPGVDLRKSAELLDILEGRR